MASSLNKYNSKRNFKNTPEPRGTKSRAPAFRFVIQRHDATRLHYDFRLELGGVLKSWAVPKGPSMNTSDKRLAVMVEDHPTSYIDFEGTIPEGNYGAGKVIVWDHGTYIPVDEEVNEISGNQALKNLDKGELKIVMKGRKIKGGFVLVRLRGDDKNWLLIKHKDEYAVTKKYDSEDLVPKAAKSTVRKVAAGKSKAAKKKSAVKRTVKK